MNATKLLALATLFAVPMVVTGCDCGPGPAKGTKLAFTAQPQGGQAGVVLLPDVRVAITDDQGNVITDAAAQVTLSLNDNPGGDTLGGTLTQTAVEGVAIFSDLALTKVAAGYTLKATSAGLADAVSDAFSISPGPPAALVFTQAPSDTDATAVIAPPVAVSLVDAFGNPTMAAGAMVTIAIGTGPAGAALGGTTNALSADGVATFGDLTLDLEGSYTLTATSGSLPVLISPVFTIRPGPPASMAFTVQPTNATAGTPIAPAVQVTLLDARGNVSRAATNAVTLDLVTNPGSGTLSGTLTRNAVNGVATFTDLSIDKAGAGYVLRASSGALPQAGSSAFDIAAGAPSRLAFAVDPTSAVAGTAIAPAVQVTIHDAFGNLTASTAAVTVGIGANPGGGTLSGTRSVNAVAGVATFNDLSVDKAGTGYTLVADSTGLAFATSGRFDVAAGAPAQLSFRVQPSSVDAGAPIGPAVEVELQDAFGNRTSSNATVTVALRSNPSGGTLSGTLSVSAVAGLATFADLSVDKAGTGYTLQASSAGLPTIPSATFDVRAGPAVALVYRQQPTNAGAGALLSPPVQVAIVDAFGNQAGGGATVTLAIASGPPGATLGGTTSQTAVAGLATFADLSLTTAGAYTLSASSGVLAPATSASFTISAGAASKLAFTVQPSNAQSATAIAPAVEVSIQDAFGNPTGSTANVTVAIGANPGGGTLSGTLTRAAVAGVATFANLSIDRAGTGYTLTAASAGLTGATSGRFDIAPGPAARLAFTVQPSNAAAGAAIAPPVQVAVQDAQGNVVTSSSATVTITLGTNPSGGTLSGSTVIAASAGVAAFSGLNVDKAGVGYTLNAASVGLAGATSGRFNITAAAADHLVFGPVSGGVLSPGPVQVVVKDAFDNTVTSSTATVSLAIGANPSGGTLSGTTIVAASAGVATFPNLAINKAGTGYTLIATSPGLISGTSNPFNVTAGPAAALAFSQQPTSAAAGAAIAPPVTVAILDAFGNQTNSTATVTVAIGANPGGGTLSGTAGRAAVAGVATFNDLSINQVGTGYTLTAASPGLTGATSAAFNVTPSAGQRLAFITPSRIFTAGLCPGAAGVITVQLQDGFGNPVNAGPGGVAFTASSTSTGTVTWFADSACSVGAAGGNFAIPNGFNSVNLYYGDTKSGTPSVSLSNGGGLANPSPQQHTVLPGAANRLAFATTIPNVVAGAAFAPAVQVVVQDAFGNTVTSSTASVTVAIGNNPGGGTLGGTTTVAATAGVATFSNLGGINKAGTGYTLIATSPGLISGTSNPFNVTPAAPSQLAFTVQPSNAAVGAVITPAVQVSILDAFGNLTGSTATVIASIGTNPSGGTLSGTTSRAAVAGVATFNDLSINQAGTGYTLVAVGVSLVSATSSAFNITGGGGPATRLAFVTQPSNAVAGVAIAPAVRVAVQDALGNTVTTSTASVTMAIGTNPGGGILGGTTTVTAVAGIATFSTLTIDRAGTGYTLVANSPGLTSASSSAFSITAAIAQRLGFLTQPTTVTAGVTIAPAVQVGALDAFGNVVTTSTATVTLAIGTNPSGGTLSGTLTQGMVAGVATFSDLSIDKAGTGYTFAVSSPGLTSATSAAFNVTAGPATRLAFVTQPSSGPAGSNLTPAIRVAVQDALGNTVTSSTASVTMAIGNNPGGGTLSGTTTVVAVAGIATFSTLSINAPGTGYTLVASSAGLTSATSNPFDITSTAAGLTYTDPPAGGKIRLVRNPASTSTTVVLDLVAAVPLTGFMVGFNLPLDATRVQANATLQTPGTALPAGSAPIAAKAALPSTGPLANVLVSGQSQKAAGAGAVPTDSAVPAGAVFYTLRLDLRAGAPAGVVFDGAALGPPFAGNLRDRAGTDVAVSTDFRIGRLDVN